MAYLNRIQIIGTTGHDAEIRVTQSGRKVAAMSVATSRKYAGDDGQTKELTQWHTVMCWGKLADIIENLHVRKGTQLYAEGEMCYRKYTGRDRTERTSAEINASSVQLLSPKRQEQGPSGTASPTSTQMPQYNPRSPAPTESAADEDDGLPF